MTTMQQGRHLLVLVLLIAVTLIASNVRAAGLLPERIARAAQESIDAGLYPAMVIGYVDGNRSEIRLFGKLDNGRAPTAETVFEIGSITKTFTATLLAESVMSGDLKLDAPVATLLPGFRIPDRNGRQITLEDLATQHSGLPVVPGNLVAGDPGNPYADYTAVQLKGFLDGYVMTRDPGESYEYSNLGFGLLGFALAQHATVSYSALVEEKILRPLHMQATSITFSDGMRANLATGHSGDGKVAKNWNFDALAGAGALRSTGADMLRYLVANKDAATTPLTTAMKFAQKPRRAIAPNGEIGLAWNTLRAAQGSVIWHNGGTGGYRAFLGFGADGQRGVVILTNVVTGVDELGFASLLDDAPLPPVRKPVLLDPASLDDYVGTYKLADQFLLTIQRSGNQLSAQATGQGAFPIYASGPNEFFARVAGISLSFVRDTHGKVSGLVIHQNGDRSAPKVIDVE